MTISRVRVGAVVLMGLMLMPLAAYSDDVADVNAALDRVVALFNAGDGDGLGAMLTENYIGLVGNSPIITDGRDAVVQGMRPGPTSNESTQVVIFGDRHVRVNGRTAVAAGTWGQFWKPMDGPSQSAFLNFIYTWVKIGREWKVASLMIRTIPHGSVP